MDSRCFLAAYLRSFTKSNLKRFPHYLRYLADLKCFRQSVALPRFPTPWLRRVTGNGLRAAVSDRLELPGAPLRGVEAEAQPAAQPRGRRSKAPGYLELIQMVEIHKFGTLRIQT